MTPAENYVVVRSGPMTPAEIYVVVRSGVTIHNSDYKLHVIRAVMTFSITTPSSTAFAWLEQGEH